MGCDTFLQLSYETNLQHSDGLPNFTENSQFLSSPLPALINDFSSNFRKVSYRGEHAHYSRLGAMASKCHNSGTFVVIKPRNLDFKTSLISS